MQSKGSKGAEEAGEQAKLSEKLLGASVTESYKHNQLDDDTEQEREAKKQAALESKRKA